MKRLRIALLLAVVIGSLLVSSVLAMESTTYQMDWFVPMTGGGVLNAASDNYGASITYGQSVISSYGASPSYHGGLGFWIGILRELIPPTWRLRLPVLFKY
jgi:hypothetical protein